MSSKFPAALTSTVLFLSALCLPAQQSAPGPIQAMPYSPSLDVSSLDRSVDPCMDFYKFSCGGWQKNNPIPADQSGWSVYAKLGNENQQFLWGILEADAKAKNRSPVQQKVGDYFAACMNTAAIDALGLKPVQPELARIDALKTRPELVAAISELHHVYPGRFFFGSGTGQDAMDSSLVIVELVAGGIGLPDRDYYLKTDAKSVKLREQYAAYIQQLLTLSGESAAQAKADADATLRIETELAKASLTRVQRRDPHNTYHMMTIGELGKIAPAFDWPHYFAMQGAPGITRLNVSQPEFLKAVQAQLTTEPVEALRAYLRFHFLTSASPFLAHPFEQANFDFYSKTLRGVPDMPPRWKTCTRAVDHSLGEALGQEFVKRTFTADTKARTQLMTEQVETAMKQEIENL
ncbi:MAG TPA: M13 family metallopeptidase N-terminal domain-containing protein, partial [Edaphobacter sp.]